VKCMVSVPPYKSVECSLSVVSLWPSEPFAQLYTGGP